MESDAKTQKPARGEIEQIDQRECLFDIEYHTDAALAQFKATI